MTEDVSQNNFESYQSPEVKSNWWRIILYFLLVFGGAFVCFLPLLIFYPQIIDDSNSIRNDLDYLFVSQVATLAGVVLGTYWMIRKIEFRSLRSYRLKIDFKSLSEGFLLGILVMAITAFALSQFNLVNFTYAGFSSRLAISFFLYLLVAVIEEVMFRGYILTNLNEKLNPFLSLAFSSILFGLFHFGNDHFTWIGCATISLSGYLMGVMVLKTGSISSAIGLHWSWNFVQGPILGFAVSGHQENGLFQTTELASELLTGGKFGVEGSIVLTAIAAMIACFYTFRFFSLMRK